MSLSAAIDRLDAIAPAFIDAALRGAVVLLLALVLTHLLRRRSAAARHLVWVGAVVIQLALPLFAIWGPKWDLPVSSGIASILPVDLPRSVPTATPSTQLDVANTPNASVVIERSTKSSAAEQFAAPPVPTAAAAPVVSGRQILLALWILGAAVILLRLAVGTSIVAALARKGNRVEDGAWLSLTQRLSNSLGIDRPLTLLRGHKLGVPITWGIVYPVVLLPDDADAWPEERRRFVLVHEMAHVKRLDALTQLAGQFALALFWFNPLVWVANRRMQMEREHACDDYVIRQGTVPSTYAEELLAMVRSLGTSERTTQPAFAALAMARRSEFEGRMLSILDPVLDRHPLSKGRTLLSALAALLLVVPLAALQPYQRTPASNAPVAPVLAVPDTDDVKLPESFDTARQNMKGAVSNLKARPRRPVGIRSASALEQAIVGLTSSSDKTARLKEYGQTDDRDMLLVVMRVARTVPSSSDKTSLLRSLAPRYLDVNDKELATAFYGTLMTIPSSAEVSSLLRMAVPYTQRHEDQVLHVIAASSVGLQERFVRARHAARALARG